MQITNPPYIATQRLQCWTRSIGEYLHSGLDSDSAAESLKVRAGNRASGDDSQNNRWHSIARVDLLREREAHIATTPPQPVFMRVLIVVDSGMGKSTLLRRLCCEIARERPFVLPIRLEVADLPPLTGAYVNDGLILQELVGCLRRLRRADADDSERPRPHERFPDDDRQVLGWLRRERSQGRIVLLIDAVDQATESSRIDTLKYLLEMPEWSACQLIVTGRPPAIAELHGQTKLFENPKRPWLLVRLLGFTPQESEQFVGAARWATLPDEVRHLLETPRVCRYLRLIDDVDWQEIHSPSDIYFHALRGMVRAGLVSVNTREFLPAKYENWQRPKLVGKQIEEAQLTEPEKYERDLVMCLLGATAFEMLCLPQPDGWKGLPNRISTEDYDDFVERVRQRVALKHHGWTDEGGFRLAFAELAKVNVALESLFFETTTTRTVARLQFRDATIKEWFAAYWCSVYGTETDSRQLDWWVYLPCRPTQHQETNPQYYWFWRYLCEMPKAGRKPPCWLQSIEPLYWPGHLGRTPVRRSCEMMHRAWRTLDEYRNHQCADAVRIIDNFQSEFPAILNGNDLKRAKIALELVPEHVLRKLVTAVRYAEICPSTEAPAYVRCPPQQLENEEIRDLRRRSEPASPKGLNCHQFWMGTAEEVVNSLDRSDEFTDEELADEYPRHQVRLTPFWLKATHVTRAEFALFDPSHLKVFDNSVRSYAPELDCPVVDVTWYESWCLALWCGMALPSEAQFEFGVRAGRDQLNDFFPQGSTASSFEINCDGFLPFVGSPAGPRLGRTVSVRCRNLEVSGELNRMVDFVPNHWGVWHPVGQVHVWCGDWYDDDYYDECHQAGVTTDPKGPRIGVVRVLRGGSWNNLPTGCRSANRATGNPGARDLFTGCRLACLVPTNTE